MNKQKLRVNGMHCGSCAITIDDELEELQGVKEAKTSYRKELTEVVFDESRVNLDRIKRAIRTLGYEAEAI